MMNLKPVHRTTAQDSPNNMDTSSQRDKSEQNNTEEPSNVEGSPKRKQDQFLAEIQERAEVNFYFMCSSLRLWPSVRPNYNGYLQSSVS